jgi:hypothetical protein
VDSEINGNGNAYDFGARMYDARLGRWWSVDPKHKEYPWNSTHAFSENSLISLVELECLEKVHFAVKRLTLQICQIPNFKPQLMPMKLHIEDN